jgi:transposase
MQKRVHSREFKLEVVRQIVTGQKRPAQACREYGLAESVLSRWRKEYQERGETAFQAQPSGEVSTQLVLIVVLMLYLARKTLR